MDELTYNDVVDAAARIEAVVSRTPVLQSEKINELVGTEVFFKCENFQPTGAFKLRGASNAIAMLSDGDRQYGVATHSSGNHGSALAYAAGRAGIPAYIVMPADTPAIKRDAVRNFGGIISQCEPGMRGRQQKLQEIVAKTGAAIVHPYDDYRVMAGQGTAALEFLQQEPGLQTLVTPVGGGGLISGTATVVREQITNALVYGVEPACAADTHAAFKSGEVNPVDNPDTIAEGLKATVGNRNLPVIRRLVDDILLVSEAEIVAAMRLLWEQLKVTIEASSAVALAPFLNGKPPRRGKIGIILTGGNVDLNRLPWQDHAR